MNFAERVQAAIERNGSFLVAGFDPVLEQFPAYLLKSSFVGTPDPEHALRAVIHEWSYTLLDTVASRVAAIKPNIAFFEQYGIPGLEAFASLCRRAKEMGVPVIADIKRGDIGSTAAAYSAAYLGHAARFAADGSLTSAPVFDVDAITVNPYLGFDTLEVFIADCVRHNKGMFVLVKTSNPGSASLQDVRTVEHELSVAQLVARWLREKAPQLASKDGFSGLGAVVGATYAEEARTLREAMPTNLFLIPGMGAQGGSARDAIASFVRRGTGSGGGLINVSRGLFSNFPANVTDDRSLRAEVSQRADKFNREIREALAAK